ncbi:hypothetical protein CK203_074633 [Vitis vinifera]|uniref:Uncharacterized protein n=1 Tax=Vitis vinifera TaxID=29760 RepID=A0A438DWD5_VITVI|nr:hypothetical protein CK203_074633 [Vitis vinifera]
MSSYNNGTANFDNLLMQTLMGRLQIRPQNPLLPQSLEDLLFDPAITSHLSSDDDNDDDSKTQLAKEESKLEKEIIRIILSGNIQSLNPTRVKLLQLVNTTFVSGFMKKQGPIIGVPVKAAAKVGGEEKDEKVGNMGLRELIESGILVLRIAVFDSSNTVCMLLGDDGGGAKKILEMVVDVSMRDVLGRYSWKKFIYQPSKGSKSSSRLEMVAFKGEKGNASLGNVGAQVLDLLKANFHFILFQDLMDSSSRHAHIEEDYALHGLSRNDPIPTPSKDFTFKDGYMSSIMGITQKELLFFS